MQVPGILLLLALGIGLWMASMSFDRRRIEEYVRGRGGRIVSIGWAPFGKGWFGEQNDRIYEVVYYDRPGLQHWATCKTSMFSGVYWTEDRVTHPKAKWFDDLPSRNQPGDPIIHHIPGAADAHAGDEHSSSPGVPLVAAQDPVDEEITRLKQRISELEKQRGG